MATQVNQPRPWSLEELKTLAKGVKEGKTFKRIWEDDFKGSRSYDAVRSASRTEKFDEVYEALADTGDIFQPEEGVDKFAFPGIGLTLEAPTFANLVRDYVSTGGDLTRSQIATKYGLKEKDVDHICRTYNLTKDSPPHPRELTARMEDDEIVDLALSSREEGIKQKVASSRARYFERKWRKAERALQDRETILARLDQWLEGRDAFGCTGVSRPRHTERGTFVHAPVADLHLGSQSWAPEVGANYDLEIGTQRLADHGRWVAGQINARFRGSAVERAFVTDLGDFLHAILSQTESGTALDKDTRDLKVFDLAFEAKVAQIDAIRQQAKEVVVIAVPGNHDHLFQTLFNRMLRLHYADISDVTVRDVYGQFAGFRIGKTAHLLDHGKGVGSLSGWKAKGTSRSVEHYVFGPGEYSQHRVYYCGHKHQLSVDTFTDIELRRLPPMNEGDAYEASLRYAGTPGAELYFLREDGLIQSIERYYPPRDLGDA